MNFTFTDEQLALRDEVRRFLARACTPDDVRAGRSDERLEALRGFGLGDLPDATWWVLVLEEAGYAGLPEPLVDEFADGDGARGALGAAADLVGAARRCIDLATAYAKEREQFGAPIGSFQAVKHHLADALVGVEFARPAVYRAAWTLASGGTDGSRDVSMAKVVAGDAATAAAKVALQVHGAIGYTDEHDLHLWMRRIWDLDRRWGTRDAHLERVAAAVI